MKFWLFSRHARETADVLSVAINNILQGNDIGVSQNPEP